MKTLPLVRLGVLAVLFLTLSGRGQAEEKWTDLFDNGFEAWQGKTTGWEAVGTVEINPDNARRLVGKPGAGIFFNSAKGSARDLFTRQKFGDVEVHLEFLIAKRSNSGIKFEGLYEVQIFDSHDRKTVTGSDCGGIYPRAELKPKYHHLDNGVAPKVNAARPAGEWQTLDVIFQTPRFDASGKKTANARFVKITLNGQVVHENVDVPFPTGHAWHNKEVPTGPIQLQGDHGPVAFRNVRARAYQAK